MAGGKGVTGWRYRQSGVQWSVLGAMGEGTDLIADVNFVMPSTGTISESSGPVDVDLDTAIVQMWIDDPAKNHGFKLQTDIEDVHIALVQMQNKDYQGVKTPKLTIEYTTGPAPPRPAPSNAPIGSGAPTSGSGSPSAPSTGSGAPSGNVGESIRLLYYNSILTCIYSQFRLQDCRIFLCFGCLSCCSFVNYSLDIASRNLSFKC